MKQTSNLFNDQRDSLMTSVDSQAKQEPMRPSGTRKTKKEFEVQVKKKKADEWLIFKFCLASISY